MKTTPNQPRRGRVAGYPGLLWRNTKHGKVYELKLMRGGVEVSNMIRDDLGRPVRDEEIAIESWKDVRRANGQTDILHRGGRPRLRPSQLVSGIEASIVRLIDRLGREEAQAAVELALSRALEASAEGSLEPVPNQSAAPASPRPHG